MNPTLRSAHGADRVSIAPDGTIVLSSRHQKGWQPPRDNGPVHAPFPGTCVRWNDDFFEVVAAEVLPVGVRYTLRPWDESCVMRTVEDYDEAAERRRVAERAAERNRERFRKTSLLSALLLGNLPGEVQERIGGEMGVRAHRMTIVGLLPFLVLGFLSVFFLLASRAGVPPPVPVPLLLVGVYFFFESAIRFAVAFMTEAPMGMLLTVAPYTIWQTIADAGIEKRKPLPPAPDPTVLERDAYAVREPLLALLPPDDQRRLQTRYGFDPIRWGRRTAIPILLLAAAGAFTAFRGGGFVSGAIAALVALEQIVRLVRASSGRPAGSVLGLVVRPFARRLL